MRRAARPVRSGSPFGGLISGVGVGAVGGGYDNTDIGRIVTLAFIDAYSKLVGQLGGIEQGSAGTAEASPTKSFVTIAPATMRKAPLARSAVVRSLLPRASDDNVGWLLNTRLAPGN